MTDLGDVLGTEPPAGVAALPAEAQARLAALIEAARTQQERELRAAFEATIKHVPFPVRPLARKLLFG